MADSVWTKDRINRLRILWAEGRTADQIAHTLQHGISRSAVLGKVHRLGLSIGRPQAQARLERPRATARRKPEEGSAPVAAALPQASLCRSPEPGVGLLSIGRGQCRWPVGDPRAPDFALCGRPVVRGAYCSGHGEVAYRPVTDSARTLESLARLG